MKVERRDVPCGSCHQCCNHELVFVHPELGDRPEDFETTDMVDPTTGLVVQVLKQHPNGRCFYLGIAGCTIHDRAPAICRKFDCKALYERLAETIGMREVNSMLVRNPTLVVGKKRSLGEMP